MGGYDLIYWTGVQRTGNLIDTTVNPNLLPPSTGLGGPQRPQFQFNRHRSWPRVSALA
jgi:hypothetical protein